MDFNLGWIAVWLIAVPLVRRGFRPAFFATTASSTITTSPSEPQSSQQRSAVAGTVA